MVFCKSGLSASEDTDHISQTGRIGAYRLSKGDGQAEKEGGINRIRFGGHVEAIHTASDLILRHNTDRQAIISGYCGDRKGYIDIGFVWCCTCAGQSALCLHHQTH